MRIRMFLILILAFLLIGCSEPQKAVQPTKPTSIDKWPADQSDFSYYINISDEMEWNLLPAMDTELTYMILTKAPIIADNGPMLMLTNHCEYTDKEITEQRMTEFPFWLYQTYRGVDWNEVSRLAEAAQSGDEEAAKTLAQYETLYLEDYETLTPKELPQIYGYWVTNKVTAASNSMDMIGRYEQVQMFMGEEKVLMDVGTLNLYGRGWDQYLESDGVEDQYMGRLDAACPTYWGDGKVTLAPMKIASEERVQILTALKLYGIEGEILDIQVSFGDTTQNWDGISPLEIPAATPATLTVTLQTRANQTVGYCEDANICVTCERNGETERLWYFASISQSWNVYELYALTVDGLDIGAYYSYTEQWQQPCVDLPKENRKIDFDDVIVQDDVCTVVITSASWDEFAYTLHLSVENHSDTVQEVSLIDTYINGWGYDGAYNLSLQPKECSIFTWYFPWEAMEAYGIDAETGEDITSIAIRTITSDYSIAYADIYPFGAEAVEVDLPRGVIVLETDSFRLYAVSHGLHEYSTLCKSVIRSKARYDVLFVMENLTGDRMSFDTFGFTIDGVVTSSRTGDIVRGRCCNSAKASLAVTQVEIAEIGEAESLAFTLQINNDENQTYPVTVDLTLVSKEK